MADDGQRLYWDADVFLAYLNNEPGRAQSIEAILDLVEKDPKTIIVTSVLTKVEISWIAIEKMNRVLMPNELERIDSLLENYHIVETVEFNDRIASLARDFMRKGMEAGGKKLRTNDAIHLASAIWVQAKELNTYNISDYHFFEQFANITIKEPVAIQPKLL